MDDDSLIIVVGTSVLRFVPVRDPMNKGISSG
jgi:hypothetical protein